MKLVELVDSRYEIGSHVTLEVKITLDEITFRSGDNKYISLNYTGILSPRDIRHISVEGEYEMASFCYSKEEKCDFDPGKGFRIQEEQIGSCVDHSQLNRTRFYYPTPFGIHSGDSIKVGVIPKNNSNTIYIIFTKTERTSDNGTEDILFDGEARISTNENIVNYMKNNTWGNATRADARYVIGAHTTLDVKVTLDEIKFRSDDSEYVNLNYTGINTPNDVRYIYVIGIIPFDFELASFCFIKAPMRPDLSASTSDDFVEYHTMVTLTCETLDDYQEVIFLLDNSGNVEEVQRGVSNQYTFFSDKFYDQGNYTCYTKNDIGNSSMISNGLSFTRDAHPIGIGCTYNGIGVQSVSTVSPPPRPTITIPMGSKQRITTAAPFEINILDHGEELDVMTGDFVRLSCQGPRDVHLEWYHDDVQVTTTITTNVVRVKDRLSLGSTKLEINSASTEHTGTYRCTGVRNNEHVSKLIRLFVIDCPEGRFGRNCMECRCLDSSEICDVIDGTCYSGCPSGYSGAGCRNACNGENACTTKKPDPRIQDMPEPSKGRFNVEELRKLEEELNKLLTEG